MMLWRLAWRGAWRNPRRTGIVLTAVAVGIAGCLVSMALNFGLVVQLVDTAIETELGHLQVHARGFHANPKLDRLLVDGGVEVDELLRGHASVRALAVRLRGEGLVSSSRASAGVRIVGIEPEREAEVSLLRRSLSSGDWLEPGERRVLIGEELARRLQVEAGSKLVLSVQDLSGELTGQAYRVGGLFKTPSRVIDQGSLFLPLAAGQSLLGVGDAVSEVVVVAADRREIPVLQASLRDALGEAVEVQTWQEMQPLLVYMVESMDAIAWVLYGAVFVAMAFGIANVLLMAVYERKREIGMLLALGLKRHQVMATILLESLAVTLLGIALGVAVAVLSVWGWRLVGGIDLSVFADGLSAYGIGTQLVPVLRPSDLVSPVVVGVVAAFLAGLWPAFRAVSALPAESLRHV